MAKGDDDTVYCDVQMPVAQGRELLQVVSALRDSGGLRTSIQFLSICSLS